MGVCVFFVKNDLFQQTGAATAVFFGPGNTDPAAVVHGALPDTAFFKRFPVRGNPLVFRVVDTQGRVQIRGQPIADFGPKGVLFRRVLKIHVLSLFVLY